MQTHYTHMHPQAHKAKPPAALRNIAIAPLRLKCLSGVQQGGVTSAHAEGRSATAVKVLTKENFTLTLDLQRLSSLTCDLSIFGRVFYLYFPIRTCACNLVYFLGACYQQLGEKNHYNHGEMPVGALKHLLGDPYVL